MLQPLWLQTQIFLHHPDLLLLRALSGENLSPFLPLPFATPAAAVSVVNVVSQLVGNHPWGGSSLLDTPPVKKGVWEKGDREHPPPTHGTGILPQLLLRGQDAAPARRVLYGPS